VCADRAAPAAGPESCPVTDSVVPRFSMLTPTFNRAHTLGRTFDSLVAQTMHPYEWIIVDDGSTDGTSELVVQWQATCPFPIIYHWQENAGKPAAHNTGVALATGDLLAIVDSDDWCEPRAIERLLRLWLEIPEDVRDRYTGVTVHCADQRGKLIGLPFPGSPIDSTIAEMWARGWCVGDKWGCHRVDVLRRFPFPVFDGERYMPEGVVWNRIGRQYLMRFVNEVLGRKEYQAGGVSQSWLRTMVGSPRGAQLFYTELADSAPAVLSRAFACINAVRFGLHAGDCVVAGEPRPSTSGMAWLWSVLGRCWWAADRIRLYASPAPSTISGDAEPRGTG
jgi:glycosyltransferase involved in cell wall biosynthesis